MTGASPRRSPRQRLRSSVVRRTTANGPGAYLVRRPPGAAVILGGGVGSDDSPTLLVPTSVIDNFNDIGVHESQCAFVGSGDPVWRTNDGDDNYVQMRPGGHVSFGGFLLPDGVPEAWFSAPKLRVAAMATSDWTDMSLEIRVENGIAFATKYTDPDGTQPWSSAGTPNDYTSYTVNPPLNGTATGADFYAEYLDANMYIYVEVDGGTGDTDAGHEVRITEMLVDIS